MFTARPSTLRRAALLAISAAASTTSPANAAAPKAGAPSDKNPGVSVKASLRYTDGSKGEVPAWGDIKITITRDDDEMSSDQPLPRAASTSYFAPPKLVAIDLDDDDEPEVIVDVYTATSPRERRTVVMRKKGNRYAADVSNWGSGGYRLDNVTGGESPEFLSADSRIPDLYGRTSRGPLRVLAYRNGKVKDISRKARRELLRDAKLHRRALARSRRKGTDTRPEVAAYAVDLLRLGRAGEAQAQIRAAARRKELRGSARSFARKLDTRLVRWGYTSRKELSRGL